MADLGQKLQKVIFSELSTLLDDPVYDHVPHESSFPYTRIGELVLADESTFGSDGQSFTANLHTFSQYRGTKEVRDIMEKIYNHFHRKRISTVELNWAGSMCEFSTVRTENDNLTRHGIQRFRISVGN